MDAGLEIYVKDNYNNEKADLLFESFELFELCSIEGAANGFYEILMQEGNKDYMDTTHDFEQLAYSMLFNVLKDHGIFLNEEAPLMIVNQFVDGIINIQYYLGVTDVMRVLESDFDSEEKLVQILSFVTPMETERALQYIESVDMSLISNINDIFSIKETTELQDMVDEAIVAKCVNKYRNVNRFLKEADTVANRLVKANVFIGSTFEEYLPFIAHKFDDMKVEQLGVELFSLLSITKDGVDNPQQCFSEHADRLFGDLTEISNITNQINKLAVQYESYIQTRRLIIKENK